ncbi:DUF3558 domain-containing protein [Actinosynnema sp. ALI-1.44]|uniref:DUF3558 family protein n=1 Tax=Actinosynnema sp. ALI-1.44 TaxID=1933779 RepID=UPI001177FBC4
MKLTTETCDNASHHPRAQHSTAPDRPGRRHDRIQPPGVDVTRKSVAALALLATACSAPGQPAPTPPPITTAPSTAGSGGTPTASGSLRPTIAPPPPARTLDVARYTGRMCESLTQEQLAFLGLSSFQSQPRHYLCRWSQGHMIFDVGTYTNVNPLHEPYKQANNGLAKVFEPFQMSGFPALKRRSAAPSTTCWITVATGNEQGFEIIGAGSETVDWCDKATRAAEYLLHNLER